MKETSSCLDEIDLEEAQLPGLDHSLQESLSVCLSVCVPVSICHHETPAVCHHLLYICLVLLSPAVTHRNLRKTKNLECFLLRLLFYFYFIFFSLKCSKQLTSASTVTDEEFLAHLLQGLVSSFSFSSYSSPPLPVRCCHATLQ